MKIDLTIIFQLFSSPCRRVLLARIPAKWNHFAEKDSRHHYLEQILIAKVEQLWRDLL